MATDENKSISPGNAPQRWAAFIQSVAAELNDIHAQKVAEVKLETAELSTLMNR